MTKEAFISLISSHLKWVCCEATQFTMATTNHNKAQPASFWLVTAMANWLI